MVILKMNGFTMESEYLQQRYKQKKLLITDKFMIAFLKFFIIVPMIYLPMTILLNFSSNNYFTLITMISISLFLMFQQSNQRITYVIGNILIFLLEGRVIYVSLWKYPEYLGLYTPISCFFLWNLNLEFIYSSTQGYLIISAHAIVWVYCSVHTGYIQKPPADVVFAFIFIVCLQYFWYNYRVSKDYEEINREIQLENKQTNIKNLINAIPEGVIVMSKNFEILLNNQASQKLLNGGQFVDLNINQKFNNKEEDISESLMKYVEEFRDSEETTTIFGVCSTGSNYLECTGSKMEWDKVLAIVLTFRDVSKIMNLKRKVNLNNKTLRMLQGVSHELKTPLNQIINEHQDILYSNENIPQEIKTHIVKSLSTSKYLLCLLRDMIDYSHLKFHNLSLNFSWVKIEEAVSECARMLKNMNNSYDITCETDIFERLCIYSDKVRLHQCLLNLATLSLG